MKKIVKVLALGMTLLFLAGCGEQKSAEKTHAKTGDKKITLNVFAAASMTETMKKIGDNYKKIAPNVTVVYNFDSSGTLKTQIQNGAVCDIFISASPKQMNQLDIAKDVKVNKDKLDFVLQGSRFNLLENKVVLVVPKNNPSKLTSFTDLANKLQAGTVRLIMGNSDVPVGQYTQKILAYLKLNEKTLANRGLISYGSNVKEVTTQVIEASGDCGVVYATDAYSAKLQTVDSATREMCGQVIYPVAIMKKSTEQNAAQAFIKYLQSDEAMQIFTGVGFSKAK